MPQLSRYQDHEVEELMLALLQTLQKERTPVTLSLVVLGNMVSNLINASFAPAQRKHIADSFYEALQASIIKDTEH